MSIVFSANDWRRLWKCSYLETHVSSRDWNHRRLGVREWKCDLCTTQTIYFRSLASHLLVLELCCFSVLSEASLLPKVGTAKMDLQTSLPSVSIFNELQTVHDKGYFYVLPSLEEDWQQVSVENVLRMPRIITKLRNVLKDVLLVFFGGYSMSFFPMVG